MEPIESSETSAYINTLTPGTYPKEKKLQSKHGESLKSGNILDIYAGCSWVQSTQHFEQILDNIYQNIKGSVTYTTAQQTAEGFKPLVIRGLNKSDTNFPVTNFG